MLEKLIKNFSSYMGIVSAIELDIDGAYVLPISDAVKVRVQQNADEEIILRAFLGELPSSFSSEVAYLRMMTGNVFGKETGGAALGLDSEGHIVMIRRIPSDVSFEDFARYIEGFTNFSEAWIQDLGMGNQEQG